MERVLRWWKWLDLWLRAEVVGFVLLKFEPLLWRVAWVWRRLLFRTCFITITGSLGKTTAKEVLGRLLAVDGRVLRSFANQSGGILILVNVLQVRPWHRYAVLEVGGHRPGALDVLAPLLKPDVVLQLGVKATHSTDFDSLEARAGEKEKLCRALGKGGIAILNGDDPLVRDMQHRVRGRTVLFGQGAGCDVQGRDVSSGWPERLSFTCHGGGEAFQVRTRLVGKHWVPSVLGPLAVARALGLDLKEIVPSVRAIAPFTSRLQPLEIPQGATLLRDEYNASIPSLLAAMEVMHEASCTGRKVLILTDLSDFDGHRKQRLRYLASVAGHAVGTVVLIGESAAYGLRRFMEAGVEPHNCFRFRTLSEASQGLRGRFGKGDLVLVKGRTTDHMARLYHSWVGSIDCWKKACPKQMLCDECWELGARPAGPG